MLPVVVVVILGIMGNGVSHARFESPPPSVCQGFDSYYAHKAFCQHWYQTHRR